MDKIEIIESTAVPMPVPNVDTDQIIPARFLKAVNREGFGEKLFNDWRYTSEGSPRADFVLNDPQYSGTILVADHNFGCGSSREHAVWALYDYGFRVVISSQFADIFKANSLNNGLLVVELPEAQVQELLALVKEAPQTQITVDLPKQEVRLGDRVVGSFEISEYKKYCLLNGYDDTDYLVSLISEIEAFEQERKLHTDK